MAFKQELREVVLTQVLLGKMTGREAAERLGVDEYTVWHWLREWKPREVPKDLAEILRDVLKKLRMRVDELLARPISYTDEKMVSSQVRTLKDLVMDIAKLEQRLEEIPVIQYQQISVQMNKLTTFMVGSLCSDCRQKVIQHLGELE